MVEVTASDKHSSLLEYWIKRALKGFIVLGYKVPMALEWGIKLGKGAKNIKEPIS
jgi:hypothetical protein